MSNCSNNSTDNCGYRITGSASNLSNCKTHFTNNWSCSSNSFFDAFIIIFLNWLYSAAKCSEMGTLVLSRIIFWNCHHHIGQIYVCKHLALSCNRFVMVVSLERIKLERSNQFTFSVVIRSRVLSIVQFNFQSSRFILWVITQFFWL